MKNLWKSGEAKKAKDKLGLLVYSSRLIGSEAKLCVWGGGNTSTKTVEKDHRGHKRRVLRIKGSGSDLKTCQREDFPPVDLDELLFAFKFEKMRDDEMVDYVAKCLLEPKAPRPSIEVLLHAFIDESDICHTHADAILSVTNTKNGKKIAKSLFGDELLWVPYKKPGFALAKLMGQAYQNDPDAKGVILENHGLITWGQDAKTAYDLTIEMVSRAEKYLTRARRKRKYWSPQVCKSLKPAEKRQWLLRCLPVLRGALSVCERVLLTLNESPDVMEFVNAKDAPRVSKIGPATPDHMLRTKRVPLFVKTPKQDAQKLTDDSLRFQAEAYGEDHAHYFNEYKQLLPRNSSAKMLDPYPKVTLVPGVGVIASGKDLKNAGMVSEIYEHSISVMTHASCIDSYRSLPEKVAFETDYWPLNLYKISLAPSEAEFSRQIGLVTGAARGIGKSIARHLAEQGAHVFLADLDQKAVEKEAKAINEKVKAKRAFGIRMDVTDPDSVRRGFESAVLTCGGLDFLVSNAGIAHVSPIDKLDLKDWDRSMAVNATGHFLVAREAVNIFKRQGIGGSLVFIASKNVLAPGKDFGAYSTAKAAESQLARILAIENGEFSIRVNMVNPDGVFEDSGLWDKIRDNRARSYRIKSGELEKFYQNRNLMKTAILPEDVAESVAFLISDRASKTTGCILTVDGGVKEAFPR